ncbi:hypothetical protein FQN50_000425 [Emmonsiellopsis sp. PD_5]|nr:hypothetical protein FQN50_000425 [Emmonsiellopsis sp. PD_5]
MRASENHYTLKDIIKKAKLGLKQTYKSLHLGKPGFASKKATTINNFTPSTPLIVQNSWDRGPCRITVTEVDPDPDEPPAKKTTTPLFVKMSPHSWFPMLWKRSESSCQRNLTQGVEVLPPRTSGYYSGYGPQMSDTSLEIQRCKEIIFESHPTDRHLTALPTKSNLDLSIPNGTTAKIISTDWPPLIADKAEASSEYTSDSPPALQYIHDPCENCPHFIGFETIQPSTALSEQNRQGNEKSIIDWIAQLPDTPHSALRRSKKVQNLYELFRSSLR